MSRTALVALALTLAACNPASEATLDGPDVQPPGSEHQATQVAVDASHLPEGPDTRVFYGIVRDVATETPLARVRVCAVGPTDACTTTDRDGFYTLHGDRDGLVNRMAPESIILRFSRPGFFDTVRVQRARGWISQVHSHMYGEQDFGVTLSPTPKHGLLWVRTPGASGPIDAFGADDVTLSEPAPRGDGVLIADLEPGVHGFDFEQGGQATCTVTHGAEQDEDSLVWVHSFANTVTEVTARCD